MPSAIVLAQAMAGAGHPHDLGEAMLVLLRLLARAPGAAGMPISTRHMRQLPGRAELRVVAIVRDVDLAPGRQASIMRVPLGNLSHTPFTCTFTRSTGGAAGPEGCVAVLTG